MLGSLVFKPVCSFRSFPANRLALKLRSAQRLTTSELKSSTYNHFEVESKWQKFWEDNKTFKSTRRSGHPKKYVLDMFPYPSGSGLHVGHPEGYTATDIMARYWRMLDYDVLHPMGWDAFGLPAEQHAIQTGTHPAVTTLQNIATFKRQLKSLGFSYDWSRELSTTDDAYVKWTQWIFLQLFKSGLASQSEVSVNWCPALGTVLANEEIINGLSERGNHPVVRQPLRQWVLKISQYADRLEPIIGTQDRAVSSSAVSNQQIQQQQSQELSSLLHQRQDSNPQQLQWPEGTLSAQKQWIGRSEGAEVRFKIHSSSNSSKNRDEVTVFTTRPDTLMGVTYLVLAPEHPMVSQLTSESQRTAVAAYQQLVAGKSDLDRTSTGIEKGKTGVALGSMAMHPITEECIPIWIADYVLGGYGTGAVMAVPAHDDRDYEFANLFHLPIKQVIAPPPSPQSVTVAGDSGDDALLLPYTGSSGTIINSGTEFDGQSSAACQVAMIDKLERLGAGKKQVTYKLRDWVFSRQRYWGEPIPIYFPVEMLTKDGAGSPIDDAPHRILYDQPIAVEEQDLPLKLPDMEDFHPGSDPQGCLARAVSWRYFQKKSNKEEGGHNDDSVGDSDNKWYARETNTMPQWAGSCWYYMRFTDPKNTTAIMSPEAASWLPVDLYVGGQEHAVLHLLYARFWHKVLFDLGIVNHSEPFVQLVHQGMILGSDNEKMSKSRGNVINPDDVVSEHGADALRLYEMFMGPLEAVKIWQTNQVMGVVRFRDKVYNLCHQAAISNNDSAFLLGLHDNNSNASAASSGSNSNVSTASSGSNSNANLLLLRRDMHRTVKKVTENIERMSFNTAISALMVYTNSLLSFKDSNSGDGIPRVAVETLVLLLSPFAPHVAEECWQKLKQIEKKTNNSINESTSRSSQSLAYIKWPEFKPEYCIDARITIAIQVNGKTRGTLQLNKGTSKDEALAAAMALPNIAKYANSDEGGLVVKKSIFVMDKVLNLIVS